MRYSSIVRETFLKQGRYIVPLCMYAADQPRRHLREHMNWGLYLFCRGERTHTVGDLSAFRGLHKPSSAAKEILQSRQRPSSPFARLTLADR